MLGESWKLMNSTGARNVPQCSTVITFSVHLEEKQHNRNAIKLANVFFFHGADLSIDYLLFLLSVSLTTTCAGMP